MDRKQRLGIKIDFNGLDATDAKVLEEDLFSLLDGIASQYKIAVKHDSLPRTLVKLIAMMYEKHQEKIVILVDEYDKPIITHLGEGEDGLQTARQNRAVSKKFFGVLKEVDVSANLRFAFITGISKFSRGSIFSDLNNLQDLTMHAGYATMLGYTQEELQHSFSDRTEEFARITQTTPDEILHKLREWYNGYRFTEEDMLVYNPFSIVNAFSQYKFKNYWFEIPLCGTFLVNLIKEKNSRLHQYLAAADIEQFIETTNAILSAIPYTQHQQQGEAFYHTVLYLMVAASGVLVQTEPLSSRGRIDIAVEFKEKVYIIESKCNQPAAVAIKQIREKGYQEKYVQSGRKIFLLGIDFDTEKREIADWRLEEA